MSNLIFNLRIWCVHFQIARDWPWFIVSYNKHHEGRCFGRERSSPLIELYLP